LHFTKRTSGINGHRILGGGDGRIAFVNSHILKETSVCLLVKEVAVQHASLIKNVRLLPEALEMYQSDPASFLTTFGDSYVVGLQPGGVFYGAVFIETTDEKRKKDLVLNLQAKVNAGLFDVKADVDYKKQFSETRDMGQVIVDVHVEGPERDFKTGNLDEMLKFASEFSKKVKGNIQNQWDINALILDYGSIWQKGASFTDKPRGKAIIEMNERRKNVISICADLITQIGYELESIIHYKGYPRSFEVKDNNKLSEYENKLNGLLVTIEDRASSCLTNPVCDVRIDDLKLPQRESFPIPVQRSESAIWLKYKDIQGESLLGSPVTGQEQSFADGSGKFVLFEKGIIISHPKHATREIHGRIFEEYKKQGMATGSLGYPTSDVRRLPDGRQIVRFERGFIDDHLALQVPRIGYEAIMSYSMLRNVHKSAKNALYIAPHWYAKEENVERTFVLKDPSLFVSMDRVFKNSDKTIG
jgi:LGFP repeat